MAEYDWGSWIKESEDSIKKWVNIKQKLFTIGIYEKVAVSTAQLLYYLLVGALMVLFVFFLCLALGFYLSDVLGSNLKGFGAVSLIFLAILFLVGVTAKNSIKRIIANTMIRELIKNEHIDETI